MKALQKTVAIAAFGCVAMAGAAEARDQIRIVGSSTVFPFATSVVETFGKTTDYKTPVIESTGSGGGLKLFCAGVGVEHPDITNASRRIKSSEIENCAANGVDKVTEVKIGYDGIVFANSKDGETVSLTRGQIFLALAKEVPNDAGELVENPYNKWSEIDPALPDAEIEVLGPPPTSGTRDAFVELVMLEGAESIPAMAKIAEEDEDRFEELAGTMREDGKFIEAGENDNLIVQKLEANPAAFGIFGYSFLEQNADDIQGATIDGTAPTFDAIASGDYPVSRSLWFYVKNAHVGTIPGMEEYLNEFTSENAWGPDGYLIDKGLIPMPEAERTQYRDAAKNLTPIGS
ncbi:substrate-binding domain-containing protein [Marivibrio halodurans]|uniref:Substrate-binding domain-containing protein n=1 Tax=Marivibrio halodurans TaxID=2039722 RepID=A0A8J7S720_9PROT|nr:substrate-binding domain-containing protein [Marivibrio halodurans]MBP5857994.1 substrate-binding domain-containing protein [Marivibrio halodurans]